ncbi:5-aminolevulic acid synthase [Alphaproteobacteria bacterium GH1-50]|uniref:5-aminolevulic acid synthase n=1 Tax=Kangsaoukella pontilimi TaxID=2691042 RepID=A0A7C9IR44_9RHOB|nr:DUF4189 domain-containing protein [Kangsaoukella pontilimi]MXQ07046.1 5-aminolevulic acid synthase [Kangsaoukella pontilimi]
MRAAVFASFLAGLAGPVAAQTLDTSGARAVLFRADGYVVQVSGQLSERDRATVRALIPVMSKEMGQDIGYYSSIAYAPDEGLISEALQGAMNYHSPAASDRAALAACDRARKGGRPCALAGRVVPKNFAPAPFTMSHGATEAFERDYRRQRGAKSFAISPSGGTWGIGRSDAEAVAECRSAGQGAGDCTVVIRD